MTLRGRLEPPSSSSCRTRSGNEFLRVRGPSKRHPPATSRHGAARAIRLNGPFAGPLPRVRAERRRAMGAVRCRRAHLTLSGNNALCSCRWHHYRFSTPPRIWDDAYLWLRRNIQASEAHAPRAQTDRLRQTRPWRTVAMKHTVGGYQGGATAISVVGAAGPTAMSTMGRTEGPLTRADRRHTRRRWRRATCPLAVPVLFCWGP